MNRSNELFFSIIVPTYNRSGFIKDTIYSLVGQTFKNFEVIVVDDGSTDNTAEIIKELQLTDERIKYFYKTNGERGAARNYGIKKAQGGYITFLDSDDIAYPFALQTAYDQLVNLGLPKCFVLGHEIMDKATMVKISKNIAVSNLNEALLKGNLLSCIGVFLKSEILTEYCFDEDREFSGSEDWLLWLKIAAKYTFLHNNMICFCMYQHNDRSVMDFPEDKLLYRAITIKQRLTTDENFIKRYGKKAVDRIYAHMLTYASLHLAISGKKKRAIHYWFRAFFSGTKEVFSRRTLAILKTLLLN